MLSESVLLRLRTHLVLILQIQKCPLTDPNSPFLPILGIIIVMTVVSTIMDADKERDPTMTTKTTDQLQPTTAVGYVRVSTKAQGESGLSIAAQKRQIRDYCKQHGLKVKKYYTDIASGSTGIGEREQLDLMLSELHAGCVVVVSKRDRLSRSMLVTLILERELKKVSCQIHSAESSEMNGEDATAELMRNIMSAVATFELKRIRTRISDALQEKKQQGFKLGKAPFGYKIENGKLLIDESTIQTRRRIEELRDEGTGWNSIARMLNAEGHSTQRARGKWYASTVFNMIKRSTVNLA